VGERLGANAIQSQMRLMYGDKRFTRPAIHVWCKKFAHGDEGVLMRNRHRRLVPVTDATIAAADSLILSDRCVMS